MQTVADILKIRNSLQPNIVRQRLYHGTNVEFDTFAITGKRLPAMGYGHYLTPNIEKAMQYGHIVMTFDVTANLLNWKSLDDLERSAIEFLLIESIPKERVAGFSALEQKFFTGAETTEAKAFYRDCREKTKDFWHDRAKAQVLPQNGGYIIQWRNGHDLAAANSEQLMGLAQEYRHDIARELGYQGAQFGDEVVVYSAECAVKVNIAPDVTGCYVQSSRPKENDSVLQLNRSDMRP
ncbi:hypothetical protein [Aeromonas veronii]|uniref:Uncharacterized protein n=1 Tax=Aeromonas veronii TaxID=654 RepID=A0A4S5CDN4_AERVE|nr:hypothetical protein [Aeromonas veronii]THJ43589.1 hypothetical protein E8Q35_14885 [Aeromonas veronii]